MLKRSLCSEVGLLHLLIPLSDLECFCLVSLIEKTKTKNKKRFLMLFIVSAPKCCPDMFFPLFVFLRCTFHFVRGPVLSTADPAFYLSYLIFIFSDIWSILPPCFKKSLLKEKEIKQLWFLKCMVVSVNSLCHIKKNSCFKYFKSCSCCRWCVR